MPYWKPRSTEPLQSIQALLMLSKLRALLRPLSRTASRPKLRPVDAFGRIAFKDGRLRSESGEPVTLRGVSLFWSQWMPQFYRTETIEWLAKDWRIDVIRASLGVGHPDFRGTADEEVAKIHAVVLAAIKCGIFVIVDWHAHEKETEAAEAIMSAIAQQYGDCPNIIYETWNEPKCGLDWTQDIKSHHVRIATAIRQYAPRAPIILGTPDFSKRIVAAARSPLALENVAYSVHFYAGSHREGLREEIRQALASGVSIFVSEWGVCEADGDGVYERAETLRWLNFLNENQIGHVNWAISDKHETCAALRPGASPLGGWNSSNLTPSGHLQRRYLRRMALPG